MKTPDSLIELFESVLYEILSSWTALELAVQHYDGPIRDAHAKRQELLECLCDAITEDKYTVEDIAEYLCDFLFEKFYLELDDNSHFEVATVSIQAWAMCKSGTRPVVAHNKNSAGGSIVKEMIEEVDFSDADENMDGPSVSSQRQPRVMTDDDGWSTVMH